MVWVGVDCRKVDLVRGQPVGRMSGRHEAQNYSVHECSNLRICANTGGAVSSSMAEVTQTRMRSAPFANCTLEVAIAGSVVHFCLTDPAMQSSVFCYSVTCAARLLRRATATASDGITRVGRVAW